MGSIGLLYSQSQATALEVVGISDTCCHTFIATKGTLTSYAFIGCYAMFCSTVLITLFIFQTSLLSLLVRLLFFIAMMCARL